MRSLLLPISITLWAAMAFCCQDSRAATVQFSDTVTDTQSDSGTLDSIAGFTLGATVSLPQFDPSLGTLTAVSWADTVDDNGSISWTVANNGAAPSNMGYSSEVTPIYVPMPSEISFVSPPIVVSGSVFFVTPGTSFDTTPVSGIIERPGGPTGLEDYIGLGTVGATMSQEVTLDASGSGLDPSDIAYSGSATMTWTRTITYTFTPVPEPSTALLGLAALTGIVVRRRRCPTD